MHLHPNAQWVLAEALCQAANSGVTVVVETHSALLLLGIQAAVAKGKIPRDGVKLHWFQRAEDGVTKITSVDLDEDGSFGEWPQDLDDVWLDAQRQYLDAAERKLEWRTREQG